ncbi:ATP:cob(I)alamin adenosyltransferase, partial [Lactobacillus delbrueckii subsp. lactis]|nr:ATP:cob(I)alamin adenosyltransferase [Lactobacillus delbrueckii subsp. lactis]
PACQGLEEKLIKLEREMYELQADLVVKRHHTITLAEVTYMEDCGFKWTGKEQAKEPLLVTTPQPTGNGRHWGADNGLTAEQVLS